MTLDASDLRRLGITRARVDRATACHYRDSGRIVIVADRGDFAAAQEALEKLRAVVDSGEYLGCMDCGHAAWYPEIAPACTCGESDTAWMDCPAHPQACRGRED